MAGAIPAASSMAMHCATERTLACASWVADDFDGARSRCIETIRGVEDGGAGASQKSVALDQQRLRSGARCSHRRTGAGGPGADHNHIEELRTEGLK
jgi:hypothetical protein